MSNLLTPEIIKSFKVGVTFSEKNAAITSTDFSVDGNFMVSANDSEQIVWLNCLRGKEIQTINSHKYGVGLVKYTHGSETVLHTSTKVNNAIRLVDVKKQSYYRYFSGHEKPVTSLSISSAQDTFASASEDKTVKIWDFRKEAYISVITTNIMQPVVTFDPTGSIFAVGFDNEHILMYDSRSFKTNKFINKIPLDKEKGMSAKDIKFSKDGTKLLVSTNSSKIMLHDAASGNPLANLTGTSYIFL